MSVIGSNALLTTARRALSSSYQRAMSSGRVLNRALCLWLVVSLLATSTPAAPQTIVGVNQLDANGLFWGKLFRFIGKAFKWIAVAAAIVLAIVAVVTFGAVPLLTTIQYMLSAASTLANAFGHKTLGLILGIAALGAGLYRDWGKAGAIWNFQDKPRTSAWDKIAAWATIIGAVTSFLAQQDTLPNDLKDRVIKIASRCTDFLNKLFDALGKASVYSRDFGVLYDRVKIELSEQAFKKVNAPATKVGMSTGSGRSRRVYIRPSTTSLSKGTAGQEHRWNAIAMITFAELIHHASKDGMFGDRAIDEAVISMMSQADQAKAIVGPVLLLPCSTTSS